MKRILSSVNMNELNITCQIYDRPFNDLLEADRQGYITLIPHMREGGLDIHIELTEIGKARLELEEL